jgi:hypothetical protein
MPLRDVLRSTAVLLAIVLPSCAGSAGSDVPAVAARVDSLADALFDTQLALNPEIGTGRGLPDAEHGRITDNSLA